MFLAFADLVALELNLSPVEREKLPGPQCSTPSNQVPSVHPRGEPSSPKAKEAFKVILETGHQDHTTIGYHLGSWEPEPKIQE